jgi:hypothetical protein
MLSDEPVARVAHVVKRRRPGAGYAPSADRRVVLAFACPAVSASLDAHARPSSLALLPDRHPTLAKGLM